MEGLAPVQWLVVLTVLAYTVQTATGFGSSLLLVTLGAHLLPLPELVALAVPLSLVQTAWVALRDRAAIDRRLLWGRILPWMGVGAGIGLVILRVLGPNPLLRTVFAVLVLLLATIEWSRAARGLASPQLSVHQSRVAMLGAGITHGLFGTGGPLLVYSLSREALDRSQFRATLSAVWLVLNVVLIATFAMTGRYSQAQGVQLGAMFLALPFGMALGEQLHHRVPPLRFRQGVYLLLAVSALMLLVR